MNKKQVKSIVRKNVKQAKATSAELEKLAMKEYEMIKKQMEATSKKVQAYVKKNPAKAAAIAAGIGATLGTIAGLLAAGGKKKKK
jgi:ElaB/YqjD/DUF883 family membrane-anchored ribosome-binding protein